MPSKYVLKPKTKEMPCRYCGEPITVGWKTKKAPAHPACSAKIMAQYCAELHNHSGSGYEKWLESMRNFAEKHPPTGRGSA